MAIVRRNGRSLRACPLRGDAVSESKERPILFSAQMVRAIIAGTKTQTRRAIKTPEKYQGIRECGFCCPYGQPGDRLWVRETFCTEKGGTVHYRADGWQYEDAPNNGWKPSIFMPRKLSRITLEVVSVIAERLQEISETDAIAEGCHVGIGAGNWRNARHRYRELWNVINGAGSWEENPWVWVIKFNRHEYSPQRQGELNV